MELYSAVQAYEGLQTAHKLKQEYVFLPAKLKEVYLTYLLEHLEDHKVHYKPEAHFIHHLLIYMLCYSGTSARCVQWQPATSRLMSSEHVSTTSNHLSEQTVPGVLHHLSLRQLVTVIKPT